MSQATRTLTLLAVVAGLAAALGLYAYFGVAKTDEAEATRKALDERLFSAGGPGETSADGGTLTAVFTGITVKSGTETTVLERRGGSWELTSPVRAPADKDTVEAMLGQLQSAKLKEKIDDNPDPAALQKYGLDAPRFTVQAYGYVPDARGEGATDPSRRREVTLLGGIENPFDGSVYLRRNADRAVYSAEGGVRFALAKTAYDLRDKALLTLEEEKITRLEVKGRYALEREGPTAWKLLKPLSGPADAAAVLGLLTALHSERAVAFPADGPSLRRSFDAPAFDVTVTAASGSTRLRLVRAGGDAAERWLALVDTGDSAIVMEVNPSAAAALDKPASDLKDKTVASFAKEKVARLTFGLEGGKRLVVERSVTDAGAGEAWTLIEPVRAAAKQFKVSQLLYLLGGLRASAVVDEKPKDLSRYGLGPSARYASVATAEGTELGRVTLGKEVPGKPGAVFVRGLSGRVDELDASRLAEFPTQASELIDAPTAGLSDDAGMGL